MHDGEIWTQTSSDLTKWSVLVLLSIVCTKTIRECSSGNNAGLFRKSLSSADFPTRRALIKFDPHLVVGVEEH